MGSEAEPAKLLLPYLQRADELQKHEPLVAYYCRLYAMEKGLNIPTKERTKTTNSLLISLINQLEKDKKAVKLSPDDNLHVEGFASNIFAKADKQDRAGKADLNTAKIFYAAYIFFDILHQFGQLQPDIEQKLKYSLWKAADIRKALKEGRKPEPGPPGGEEEESSSPPSTTINTYDLEPSTSFSAGPPSVDDTSPQVDKMNSQPPPSPPSYHSSEHPSADFRHTPPSGPPENSDYPQPYHQQSFSSHHSMPQNYPSQNPQSYHSKDVSPHDYHTEDAPPRIYSNHEAPPPNYPPHNNIQSYSSHESSIPPYTYPNFQSYPSFNDTTLPAAPTHYTSPSHYQGSEASTGLQTAPAPSYAPPAQYTPPSGNGNHSATTPTPAAAYTYDSNYQPPVEKIADAHKAARFAVGALAFDDVAVAVDFLKRSLDLLTNPLAESH